MRYLAIWKISETLLLFFALRVSGLLFQICMYGFPVFRSHSSWRVPRFTLWQEVFFVVRFDSVEERNAIFSNNFTWDEKFPLMAKIWHKDFNLLIESLISSLCG